MVKQVFTPVNTLVPTTAIGDDATRTALQMLSNAWSVRNGKTEQRFITAAELTDPKTAARLVSQGFSYFSNDSRPPAGDVAALVDGVANSVMQSKLWQDLGERINLLTRDDDWIKQDFSRLEALSQKHWNEFIGAKIEMNGKWSAWQHERDLLLGENSARANQIAAMHVQVNENWAAWMQQVTLLTNADAAMGEKLEGLKTQFEQNSASWTQKIGQLVTADAAMALKIDTLSTQVGANSSLIQNFQTTQTNWNTSYAQQVSQLQTKLANNTAAIQQEAAARIAADGTIEAKYTVKIDVNGYVSGYGLMSTANNAAPTSDFIVRADRFAIGSPSGPDIPPRVPFTVLTTTDANGTPPGVYIDSAFIKYASIDTANIRDLAVDTLKIKGQAVTIPTMNIGANMFWHDFGGYPALILVSVTQTGGYDTELDVYIEVGGVEIHRQKVKFYVSDGKIYPVLPIILMSFLGSGVYGAGVAIKSNIVGGTTSLIDYKTLILTVKR